MNAHRRLVSSESEMGSGEEMPRVRRGGHRRRRHRNRLGRGIDRRRRLCERHRWGRGCQGNRRRRIVGDFDYDDSYVESDEEDRLHRVSNRRRRRLPPRRRRFRRRNSRMAEAMARRRWRRDGVRVHRRHYVIFHLTSLSDLSV